jgi:predicted nucleic acid-binding protein
MACLDTSFLVDLLHGKPQALNLKETFDRGNEMISVAAPSVMELWLGALQSKYSGAERAKILGLLEVLDVMPLDLNAAKEAAEIEADLVSRGVTISTEDIMIAAIAKVNGEKVVTRDEHFTRIPGLIVLKY